MVKNSPANAGDAGWIRGLRRSSGGGHGNSLQYSFLENPMDRGAWQVTATGLQRVGHNWETNTSLSLQGVIIICIIKLCFLNGTSEWQIWLNTKTWVKKVDAGETVICGNGSGLIYWSGRKKWVTCNYRFSLPLASASSSIVNFITCFEQILFFFFLPNHSLCRQEAN